MKTNRAGRIRLVCLIGALALISGACAGNDEPKASTKKVTATTVAAPSVAITSPASGTTVKGNVVSLALKVSGLTLVKADGDTSGHTGHIHAFIDREPVAPGQPVPKEPGIVHSADNPLVLTGLSVGTHTITVVIGDGTHTRLGSSADKVTVTVAGPSVDATAPATVAAGQPVRIEFKVAGVSIVKADGDTSGKTAHFHVFVDKPLPALGEAIPKPDDGSIIHTAEAFVEIPNLASGEHTFFVVMGDGAHVPLSPLVADKVTVTVG